MDKKIRIAIIGMGQMGGSLGRALRAEKLNGKYHVTGIDKDKNTLNTAFKIGAADTISQELESVKGSDIAVICLPVDLIVPMYKQLLKIVGKETIITDTGSTKELIVKQIEEVRLNNVPRAKTKSAKPALFYPPLTFSFVPAHPWREGKRTASCRPRRRCFKMQMSL